MFHKDHKNILTHVFLLGYLIFSLGYIGYDTWSDFQIRYVEKVRTESYNAAVVQLITEAEKCKPFSIFAGEKKIELVNTGCEKNTEGGKE